MECCQSALGVRYTSSNGAENQYLIWILTLEGASSGLQWLRLPTFLFSYFNKHKQYRIDHFDINYKCLPPNANMPLLRDSIDSQIDEYAVCVMTGENKEESLLYGPQKGEAGVSLLVS